MSVFLTICPIAAKAQTIVASDKPSSVSVTLYRAPDRPPGQAIDLRSPQGYALVTETRTIALPAGPAVIRFAGVAGNILPESAIITGLPQDVAEKNLDADLLSPRTLYDRALGRRVMIRRTDPATGKAREQQATIRSSADGAAVLEVAGGYEALRCSGLPETIVQTDVPDGLSARPTLSIATTSPRAVSATITLSYLAGGFDWQADYVLNLRAGGTRADIAAWVTLASSDVTTLPDARAQLVAGKPNREETPPFGQYRAGALTLRCWPTEIDYASHPPPPPPPPASSVMMYAPAPMAEDIVVTAMRRSAPGAAVEVVQSELGDLKLYTVPLPTTVASQAQKQVALMTRTAVPLRMVYVSEGGEGQFSAAHPVLRMRNRRADGLGLPLPAGQVMVLEEAGARPILRGIVPLDDKAVDEEVELDLPATPGVIVRVEQGEQTEHVRRYTLRVSNANPWPIAYEAKIAPGTGRFTADRRVGSKDGRRLWAVEVPANGEATLRYTVRDTE